MRFNWGTLASVYISGVVSGLFIGILLTDGRVQATLCVIQWLFVAIDFILSLWVLWRNRNEEGE